MEIDLTQAQMFCKTLRQTWEQRPADALALAQQAGAESIAPALAQESAHLWRFKDGSTLILYDNGDGVE